MSILLNPVGSGIIDPVKAHTAVGPLSWMKGPVRVRGKHPIAGLRQLEHSDGMTLTSHYAPGPSRQALLAAMVSPSKPLLPGKSAVTDKPNSPNIPIKFRINTEDYRNHGIDE
jgi:hypothetical protein